VNVVENQHSLSLCNYSSRAIAPCLPAFPVAAGRFLFRSKGGHILPKADVVIWVTAVALIMIMLGVIGYLINKGFDGMKASIEKEFAVLWGKLNEYQKMAETSSANMLAHKEAEIERQKACEERHRRVDSELVRLSLEVQQKD
jgi:hypothetical protein